MAVTGNNTITSFSNLANEQYTQRANASLQGVTNSENVQYTQRANASLQGVTNPENEQYTQRANASLQGVTSPANVQYAQRMNASRGVTNPVIASIAAIKYERAPMQGATVDVTDKNGNPLLLDYMPDGMVFDCFA